MENCLAVLSCSNDHIDDTSNIGINAPSTRATSENLVFTLKISYIFLIVVCSLRHRKANYLGENQPLHVISGLLDSDSLRVTDNKEIIVLCP